MSSQHIIIVFNTIFYKNPVYMNTNQKLKKLKQFLKSLDCDCDRESLST